MLIQVGAYDPNYLSAIAASIASHNGHITTQYLGFWGKEEFLKSVELNNLM